MSSSVFPDPAGARTMKDVRGSSARARAAASGIDGLPYAAQRNHRTVLAGFVAVFRIDSGIACLKLFGERRERPAPFADLRWQRRTVFSLVGPELRQRGVGGAGAPPSF